MKKVIMIFACVAAVAIFMTSCFDEDPGNPVAIDGSGSKWSASNAAAQPIEIGIDDAYTFNNDLAAKLANRSGPITNDDISVLRNALSYMGQFNLFVHEESKYIEEVNKLYRSIYNMYTGNSNLESVYTAISEYGSAYAALSSNCKSKMNEFDKQQLTDFADAVYNYSCSFMKS